MPRIWSIEKPHQIILMSFFFFILAARSNLTDTPGLLYINSELQLLELKDTDLVSKEFQVNAKETGLTKQGHYRKLKPMNLQLQQTLNTA